MKGYILTTTQNTNDWIVYNNDISVDYQEFLKGQSFQEKELPLVYNVQNKSKLKKIKSAIMLESSGPELVSKRFKEVLEANTDNIQFFEVELYCECEKIEGFYAMNLLHKIKCIDINSSEFRLMNFDLNNPNYMFYYMKLKNNIFRNNNIDIVRCEEMGRYIVVSEKIKEVMFDANLKGLQFSDSIDITPRERTVYEKI